MNDPDWKKKVDKHLLKEEKRISKERTNLDEIREEAEEEEKKIQTEFFEKFKCGICGKDPEPADETRLTYPPADIDDPTGSFEHYDDWTKPGNMSRCTICKNWFCSDHYYKGYCEKDAQKL